MSNSLIFSPNYHWLAIKTNKYRNSVQRDKGVYDISKIRGNRGAKETTFKFQGSEERTFYEREKIFKMQGTSEERGNN